MFLFNREEGFLMFLLRTLLVLGLAFGLTGFAGAADQAKKKKKAGTLRASVKEVQVDKDNPNVGTLTVAVTAGKKKKDAAAPAPAPETRKITIAADTKIEKMEALPKGQKPVKGQVPAGQAAKFSDIQANSNVLVVLKSGSDNTAEKVLIVPAKKKAKKQAN